MDHVIDTACNPDTHLQGGFLSDNDAADRKLTRNELHLIGKILRLGVRRLDR